MADMIVEALETYWMLIPIGFVAIIFAIAVNASWERTDWGIPLAIFAIIAMSILTLIEYGPPIMLLAAGGMLLVVATTLKEDYLTVGGAGILLAGLGVVLQFSFDDPAWTWLKEQEAIRSVLDLPVVVWLFEGPWYEDISHVASLIGLPLLLLWWLGPRLLFLIYRDHSQPRLDRYDGGLGNTGIYSFGNWFNRSHQASSTWNDTERYRPTRITAPRRPEEYAAPINPNVLNDTDASIWERHND
ncbi:MAG: hypothetical protein ACE5Q6_04655 [Dehalococcoidia bacterium]